MQSCCVNPICAPFSGYWHDGSTTAAFLPGICDFCLLKVWFEEVVVRQFFL